jgi:DNA-binding beta-propeller fold protein YncE
VLITLSFSGGGHAAKAPTTAAFDTGSDNQLGLTFTPDGATAFWVAWDGAWGSSKASRQRIYTSRLRDGEWATPAPIGFSGKYSDSDPFVSPDGRWLYFVSERPSSADDELTDTNIWRYSLVEEGRIEYLSINSGSEEYSPVVSASGTLYFASNRAGKKSAGDLYRAEPVGDGFGIARPLGPAFNTPTGEWNLWVSPDESEIIFEASSRATNVSTPGDLYYSWNTPAGWTPAIPVASLNSRNSDLMPRLHPDGDTLYYTSAPIGGHARIVATRLGPLREQLRSDFAPPLMVANRSSHEVTFVDLSRGDVLARVATGEGPHLLSNVHDGRVLATGYGEFPKPHAAPVSNRPPFVAAFNSRLTLIDSTNQTVLLDTTVEDCKKPHASWIVGEIAYVTCETEGHILAVDLHSGATIRRFETLQDGSHVLGFEPESRILSVSNTDSGSVTLINIDSGETTIVKLAAGSEGVLAVNRHFWVSNALDGSISVVDPRTAKVVKHIDSVCKFPIAVSQDSQEQIWVACFASAELVSIDAQNRPE